VSKERKRSNLKCTRDLAVAQDSERVEEEIFRPAADTVGIKLRQSGSLSTHRLSKGPTIYC
jgi:hypothetical protein